MGNDHANPTADYTQAGRSRLDGLDALRGVAAMLVVVMHVQHINGIEWPLRHAYLAVDVFFVLSGYVMARTYEPKMAQGLKPIDFFVARLRRLWPTMAIGAAIGLAVFWGDMPVEGSLIAFAMALAFLPMGSNVVATFPTNMPAWSICFELIANLLHALVLRLLGVPALLAVSACAAVWLVASAPDMDVGGHASEFVSGVARVLFSYCVGIVIWRWRRDRAILPGWLGLVLLPLGIIAIGVAPDWTRWYDFAFVFVGCPLIVLSGLTPPPFARAALSWLGSISFPLYAVHFPVAMMVTRAGLGVELSLVVILAVAWAVTRATDGLMTRRATPRPLPA